MKSQCQKEPLHFTFTIYDLEFDIYLTFLFVIGHLFFHVLRGFRNTLKADNESKI